MNHRLVFGHLSMFACLLQPAAMAGAQVPTFEPPVLLQPVDVPEPGGSAWSPVAASAGSGTWVAVWNGDFPDSGDDDEILFSRSLDGGLTFSTQAVLNSDAFSDTYQFFDSFQGIRDHNPGLAGDATGTLVAVWQREVSIDSRVMLARSTDAGQSWSSPAILNSESRFPSIATDGGGTWIVVWTYDSPHIGGPTDNAIGISRSTDGGQTWSPPAPLVETGLGNAIALYQPSIAWSGGVWMLTWANEIQASDERDAFFARSLDGGATWTPATSLAVVGGSDRNQEGGPVAAGDNSGNWVMAWTSANSDFSARTIVAARSSDNGETWSAPQFLPAAADSKDSGIQIAASPSGTFVAVWGGLGGTGFGEDSDVFVSASTDQGATWSPVEALNDATTDEGGAAGEHDPFIAHDPAGHWLAFWTSEDRRLASGTKRWGLDIVVSLGDHACGNGLPDPGEGCDTGHRGDLDCCSNVCAFDSSGTACAADDELCTLERCDGAGSCEHLAAPAGTACTPDDDLCSYDRCNGFAVCEHVDAAREDCKVTLESGGSDLAIEIGSTPGENALKWSWRRGEANTGDDIGGLIGGLTYALCIYDADGLDARLEAPAGPVCSPENKSSCWRFTGNRLGTMRYRSRDGMPGGVTKLQLKEGKELRSRVKLAAKGAGFVPPALPMSGFPLRVQLNSDQACWEATYSVPTENSDASFQATSD